MAVSTTMKVLVVSQHFWPETFRINEVVESLVQRGCELTVLTGQPNYPDGKIFSGYRAVWIGSERHVSGYTIHRVPIAPRGRGGVLRLVTNYLSFMLGASLIGPFLLRGKRFDVVFVYAVSPILQVVPAILIRSIKRARLVIWVQDLWPRSLEATGYVKSRWILSAVALLTGWIYRRADLLLVPSRGFEKIIRPSAPGVDIIFHPNPAERKVGRGGVNFSSDFKMPQGFCVVFAGNLGVAQALDTVLEAAALLAAERDVNFVLVGSGTMLPQLTEEVRRRGLTNVSFPGRYPAAAMTEIYARASALLVSLVRDDVLAEIVPSKVPTYLAAGRPIIAALEGEGAEVVRQSRAGIVVPPQDASALAAAVIALKQMPKTQRDAMGERGHKYFQEHYDPDRLAAALLTHFERVSAGRDVCPKPIPRGPR